MNRLPAGPSSVALNTVQVFREPYEHLVRCAHRYGDPFTLPHVFGQMVMTGHPDGVRAIFSADPDIYDVPGVELSLPLLGESSLILVQGATHKAARRLLTPPFHGERMEAYGELMRETTLRHGAEWRPGVPFKMQDSAEAISLEVIIRAVFGANESSQVRRYGHALIASMRTRSIAIYFKALRRNFFGLSKWARLQRALKAADDLIYAEIAAARGAPSGSRADILSLLVSARHEDGSSMADREIRDQLMTLVLAGYDATAVLISFACYLLYDHPRVLERLRAELATAGAEPAPKELVRLPYLEAVCQEALRMYPILGSVIRLLKRPMTLMGYEIPAGKVVAASAAIAHRREETFPDAQAFKPERFLDRPPLSPFEYFPFGGGARRCIGAAFALYEMRIVLATIVQNFPLRLVPGQRVRPIVRGVTVLPEGGVQMVLSPS
jgi:cytochrome P450 family 110